MVKVELKSEVEKNIKAGDFLVLGNGEVRQVCEDIGEGFCTINLDGQVQTDFFDGIEPLLKFYDDLEGVCRVIKSENMKLVEL